LKGKKVTAKFARKRERWELSSFSYKLKEKEGNGRVTVNISGREEEIGKSFPSFLSPFSEEERGEGKEEG